jgi:hypothetical protein
VDRIAVAHLEANHGGASLDGHWRGVHREDLLDERSERERADPWMVDLEGVKTEQRIRVDVVHSKPDLPRQER